jgi:hypothetical protein
VNDEAPITTEVRLLKGLTAKIAKSAKSRKFDRRLLSPFALFAFFVVQRFLGLLQAVAICVWSCDSSLDFIAYSH